MHVVKQCLFGKIVLVDKLTTDVNQKLTIKIYKSTFMDTKIIMKNCNHEFMKMLFLVISIYFAIPKQNHTVLKFSI